MIEKVLQFFKSFLRLIYLKHLEQMYLRGIKYGCFHLSYPFFGKGNKNINTCQQYDHKNISMRHAEIS